MRGNHVVHLSLHVRVYVQFLAQQLLLINTKTVHELVAGVRRRVAAILLL